MRRNVSQKERENIVYGKSGNNKFEIPFFYDLNL